MGAVPAVSRSFRGTGSRSWPTLSTPISRKDPGTSDSTPWLDLITDCIIDFIIDFIIIIIIIINFTLFDFIIIAFDIHIPKFIELHKKKNEKIETLFGFLRTERITNS